MVVNPTPIDSKLIKKCPRNSSNNFALFNLGFRPFLPRSQHLLDNLDLTVVVDLSVPNIPRN
jgi:hypothetical protein